MAECFRFVFMAMGSECILDLYSSEETANKAALAAELEVLRIEGRLSRYRSDSLLSRINLASSEGESIELDEEMASLIDYAFACYRKSDGLFDISTGILRRVWNFSTCQTPNASEIKSCLSFVGMEKLIWNRPMLSFPIAGMELDFGGIGKEYAADRAASICSDLGVKHGLVNLGGDIRVIGPNLNGTHWSISICNPLSPQDPLSLINLQYGGLATSGNYERFVTIDGKHYGHILNPLTGYPVNGLLGVTVAAESCLVAGSVSSIAMLKGKAGVQWLSEIGLPCLSVDTEGKIDRSGWPER